MVPTPNLFQLLDGGLGFVGHDQHLDGNGGSVEPASIYSAKSAFSEDGRIAVRSFDGFHTGIDEHGERERVWVGCHGKRKADRVVSKVLVGFGILLKVLAFLAILSEDPHPCWR